jgi:hypothetical protein
LQHFKNLECAVFTPAYGDDTIPVFIIFTKIFLKNMQQFIFSFSPVYLSPPFITAAGIANPLMIEIKIGFCIRHYASFAIIYPGICV